MRADLGFPRGHVWECADGGAADAFIAERPARYVLKFSGAVGELPDMPARKAEIGEHMLRVEPIILQPIAIGAAADHLIAFRAQRILHRAEPLGHALEQDHAVAARLADPGQAATPVVDAFDHAGKRAARIGVIDRDAHLVPLVAQPEVERREVAGFGYAQEAHRGATSRPVARPPGAR